jgi:hypothetical protein
MKILIVTRNRNQEIPKFIEGIKDKKVVWKNRISKRDFDKRELIITLGGDGTFLSATHFIKKELIIGVNTAPEKSEGHLTSVNLENLEEKFKDIINGKFRIKEYTREKVKLFKKDRCVQTESALNETYFGNKNPHHPSNYEIIYKSKKEFQRSSGVLVSTGAGSTAWYRAMNGWRFRKTKKQLKFKIRELFSGRLFKPKIKKGNINQNEILGIISRIGHGILAIDSIRTHKVHKGDRIEISIGEPLRVIQ